MHSLPALGHANVHETAEVKKREQLPATKKRGDSSSSSRAVEKTKKNLCSLKSGLAVVQHSMKCCVSLKFYIL